MNGCPRTAPTPLEVDVPQRTVPALPHLLDGQPVEWQPWEHAPVMSHIDPACEQCAHPGPQLVCLGRVFAPVDKPFRRTGGTLGALLRLFVAFRCPACQELKVYDRGGGMALAYYRPPRTETW